MPNLAVDRFRLGPGRDKRRKIPDSEHKRIKELRNDGWSWRKIAALYGVDHRTIQFIVHPERLEAARKNYDWREHYTKERRREAMRKHRARKREAMLVEKLDLECRWSVVGPGGKVLAQGVAKMTDEGHGFVGGRISVPENL